MHIAKISCLKVHNSMAFSSGRMFAAFASIQSWNTFITPKGGPVPIKQAILISPC